MFNTKLKHKNSHLSLTILAQTFEKYFFDIKKNTTNGDRLQERSRIKLVTGVDLENAYEVLLGEDELREINLVFFGPKHGYPREFQDVGIALTNGEFRDTIKTI